MKKCILFLLLLSTVISSQANANAWYAGGTLHHASIGEWLEADPRNVLATTSDFIIPNISEDIAHTLTMDDLKKASDEVAACFYVETTDPSTYALEGSGVLLSCISQLKAKFPWLLTKTE